MSIYLCIVSSVLLAFSIRDVAVAEENDPFSKLPPVQEEEAAPKAWKTNGGFKVSPVRGGKPDSVHPKEWPTIGNPTSFNRHFDKPYKIWRVDGGYFGAFDGGEWGGGLFFATDHATKWTRIVDTHIQDLESFAGDTYLATGGLAHMSLSGGKTYLITRLPTGEWHSRIVFSSEMGIPRVVGTSATNVISKAESKMLIVLGLEHPIDREPFFGFDVTGTVHYLGERAKINSSEAAPPNHE